MNRLTIYMTSGDTRVLDFERDDEAAAALHEVNAALTRDPLAPVTIAGRFVVRPGDVQSAELGEPPTMIY